MLLLQTFSWFGVSNNTIWFYLPTWVHVDRSGRSSVRVTVVSTASPALQNLLSCPHFGQCQVGIAAAPGRRWPVAVGTRRRPFFILLSSSSATPASLSTTSWLRSLRRLLTRLFLRCRHPRRVYFWPNSRCQPYIIMCLRCYAVGLKKNHAQANNHDKLILSSYWNESVK